MANKQSMNDLLVRHPSSFVDRGDRFFSTVRIAQLVNRAFRSNEDVQRESQRDLRTAEERRIEALARSREPLRTFVNSSAKQVLRDLATHEKTGLTSNDAASRLLAHGPNELEKDPPKPLWKLILEQFNDLLVIMLLVSCVVSAALGELPAAIVIFLIVMGNAWLGVVQEARAGAALDALESMASPNAEVIRDGRQVTVASSELVPGDILILETGQKIAADIRLTETQEMQSNEMALTGESEGVKKDANWIGGAEEGDEHGGKEAALTDANMVYMGCTVHYGRGKGVVVKTGMMTRMGEIAHLIKTADTAMSPLQQKLHHLGVQLGIASVFVSVIVFIIGVSTERGADPTSDQPVWLQMLLVAVSLTVAAVPEGLPAAVTITLAAGMRNMVKKNALIRNLHSVETLGSATVICTDKTGTLTAGKMTAKRVWFQRRIFRITGQGYDPTGCIVPEDVNELDEAKVHDSEQQLQQEGSMHHLPFMCAVLCSNAELQFDEAEGKWTAINNPSERPLVVAGRKCGMDKRELDSMYPRVVENPFSSLRKMMSCLVDFRNGRDHPEHFIGTDNPSTQYVSFVKGAPNIVLQNATKIVDVAKSPSKKSKKGKKRSDSSSAFDRPVVRDITPEDRRRILQQIDDFSGQAFRVLAMAYQTFDSQPDDTSPENLEQNLTLVGLVASIDPERPEVEASIRKAARAGIRTVMITGDYVKTAKAIAENIGLLPRNSPPAKAVDCAVVRELGDELKELHQQKSKIDGEAARFLSDKIANVEAKLDQITAYADVYARAKPEDKITIVRSLQRQGHVSSMTGDGVNDAPALKQANIGVAMGITGTDVAKAAADMVLTDDNFTSIVEAVEEGRTIYANISKFVFYLLSTNVSEVFLILIGVIIGLPSPLSAIQILWLNLVTDGFPAIALALEATEPGIMDQGPRLLTEPLLEKLQITGIAIQTVVLTTITIVTYMVGLYWNTGEWNGSPSIDLTDAVAVKELSRQIDSARTMIFYVIVFAELLRAYGSRSMRVSTFSMGFFSNRYMQMAVGSSVATTLLVANVPGLQDIFDLRHLDGREWGFVLGVVAIPLIVDEATKYVYRRTGYGARPLAIPLGDNVGLAEVKDAEAVALERSMSGLGEVQKMSRTSTRYSNLDEIKIDEDIKIDTE